MSYQTIPIVAVKPVEEYFIITWQVDLKCNFDCMYCPPNFHDLSATTKTLDQLQNAWIKMFTASKDRNLKYKINFTGGEISLNKNFIDFLKWLRNNYDQYLFQLGVSTNGSASQKYYLELIKLVDFITFSTHSEFFNEKKFFENVIACSDQVKNTQKTIQVSIMNEPWHSDRIKIYVDFLTKHNINYSVNEIDFSMKIRNSNNINKNKKLFDFYESEHN